MDAARLPRLLRGIPSKVNIIPYNPVPGLPFESPSAERALAFQNAVRLADIPVYIRTSRGSDAAAACGSWPRALTNLWKSVNWQPVQRQDAPYERAAYTGAKALPGRNATFCCRGAGPGP